MDDFSCFLAQFSSIFNWLDNNKAWIFIGAGLFFLGIGLLMSFASSSKKRNTKERVI